jgi:hypothetical protein
MVRPCTIRQGRASDHAELIAAKKNRRDPMRLYDQSAPPNNSVQSFRWQAVVSAS